MTISNVIRSWLPSLESRKVYAVTASIDYVKTTWITDSTGHWFYAKIDNYANLIILHKPVTIYEQMIDQVIVELANPKFFHALKAHLKRHDLIYAISRN